MTPEQIGQQVKQAHPGIYDNRTDAEVGGAYTQKYSPTPAPGSFKDWLANTNADGSPLAQPSSAGSSFQDWLKQQAAVPAMDVGPGAVLQPRDHNAFDALSSLAKNANDNFLGGVLHGGANLVKLASPDTGNALNQWLDRRIIRPDANPTAAGSLGKTIGSAELGATEAVGSLAMPTTEGAGLVPALGRAGLNALTGAALEGASTGDRTKTLEAAALGGALPLALEGGSALLKKGANTASDFLYNNTVGTPLTKKLSRGVDNAQFLKASGVTGSYEAIGAKLKDIAYKNAQQAHAIVNDHADTLVDVSPLIEKLTTEKAALERVGQPTAQVDNILATLEREGTKSAGEAAQITAQQAQDLKGIYDSQMRQSAFNSPESSLFKTVRSSLNRSLNEGLGVEYTKANSTASKAIDAGEAIARKAAQTKKPFDLTNSIGLLGTLVGHPAALAIPIAEKAINNPSIATPTGKVLNSVAKSKLSPELLNVLQKAEVNLSNLGINL